MSITYTSLTRTVSDFLARNDISKEAMDNFIMLVEADINAAPLQPKEQDELFKVPMGEDNTIPLPSDYRSAKMISVGDSGPLQQVDQQTFFENEQGQFFTTIGSRIYFGKNVQGDEVRMLYSKRVPSLVKNETNKIAELYPSLYIYGCLKQAAMYIDDKAKMAIYDQAFSDAIESCGVDMDTSRYSGSRLRAIPAMPLLKGQ